jgi:hypothetical protein
MKFSSSTNLPVRIDPDLVDSDELGLQPRLPGEVLQIPHRLPVLDLALHTGEMDEAALREDFAEPGDQLLVQRIELSAPSATRLSAISASAKPTGRILSRRCWSACPALYSSSLAGPSPSYAKSKRP